MNKTGKEAHRLYRFAICDDNKTDSDYVLELVQAWASQRSIPVHTEQYMSAESFLFRYAEDKGFQILLLDIEMGHMDGVALAKRIRRENDDVQIVFITGYPDYIAEGYEVSALNYLIKPVMKEKLYAVLDRAMANLQKARKTILLPVEGEILKLETENIQYVEAFSHSIVITTKASVHEVRKSMSEMEKLLGDGFVRCHRSYLVGLRFISRITKTTVILDNGKTIPVSRSAAPAVHRAFVSYYSGVNASEGEIS